MDHPLRGLLDNTPRLTRVKLGYMPDLGIDWSRLVVLQVYVVDYPEGLLSVLSQTKQLEKLATYTVFFEFNLDPKGTPLSLPFLKMLTLGDARFLSVLQTPSLEGLSVASDLDTTITSFLTRSSCQLKSFGRRRYGGPSLHNILQHTPDLTHLSLDNHPDLVKAFGELSFHRGTLPLAPHLQSLTVLVPYLTEIGELSALLESRATQVLDDAGHLLVQKLQKLTVVELRQPAFKRAVVEELRQQCQTQSISFIVETAKYRVWPHDDHVLDW